MNILVFLKKQKTILSFALMMGLVFVIYSNAIGGGFILEDFDFIKNNPYVKNWKYVPEIFTREVGAGSGGSYTYYRPLHIFSYLIEYSFWNLNVQGYHITNIVLHSLIGFLIYGLVFFLFNNRLLSLWTALLFVVHPIHNSVVGHIAGRENLLGAFFLLSSFILYIRISRKRNLYLYPVLLGTYALALLSKENNLMFPFLLGLYHYISREKIRPSMLIGVIATCGLYLVLRGMILEYVPFNSFSLISIWQRVPGAFVALTKYFLLLTSPIQIHTIYDNIIFRFSYPQAVIGFVISTFMLVYACRKRHIDASLSFSIFWFCILYIPVSNLYPLNAYMSEHRIYLASLGYFLIVAKTLYDFYQNPKWKKLTAGVFVFLLINNSLLTYQSNHHWKSWDNYVSENFRMNPGSAITLNAYGCLKYRHNENSQAIGLFKRAIKITSDYVDAYINLGAALRKEGDYQGAIRILETAIAIGPPKAEAFHNLGAVYSDMRLYREAERLLLKSVELNPYEKRAYYNLGQISLSMQDPEKAIGYFKKVLELDSQDIQSHSQLCRVYYLTGRPDLANIYCEKYIHLISPNLSPGEVQKIKEEFNRKIRNFKN